MKEKMDINAILSSCDHTLLLQDATWDEIRVICDDAKSYKTTSVCIPPCYAKKHMSILQVRYRYAPS